LQITRRQALGGVSALVLVGVLAGVGAWMSGSRPVESAPAKDTANPDIMAPGPLGEQTLGNPDAPVTVIEYASVTCSHCADFHTHHFPALKSRYIDTGKVRFIFREFARDQLDMAGFMLARCAGNDKFFPVVDTLFERQQSWAFGQDRRGPLLAIAKQAGMSEASFEQCLTNQQIENGLRAVRDRAADKFGVTGTPTFFINGKIFRGNPTADDIGRQIDSYLKTG